MGIAKCFSSIRVEPEQIKRAVKQILAEPKFQQAAEKVQREFAQYNVPIPAQSS